MSGTDFRRTKIICTIGPTCNRREQILELAKAGMSVARLNFSHASHEEHLEVIRHIKSVREELNTPLAIMLDTKGPEIRIDAVPGDGLALQPGFRFYLVKDINISKTKAVSVDPPSVIDHLRVGDNVLIDDGYIDSHVVECHPDYAILEAHNFGTVHKRKGINLPGKPSVFPDITERDIEDIRFGCEQDIDMIAASFICIPEQVIAIKKLLADEGSPDIHVIAKIESCQGVDNFDQILQVADGIMVARGDLGVEMPITVIPRIQKAIIKKCAEQAKPVIIATQMLESMIHCPRPTRAEVSDVANAIYDLASAVMLSGETANGKYPVAAVKMMDEIIREAERDVDAHERFFREQSVSCQLYNIPAALARAAVATCIDAKAKAIVVFSKSGNTARLISRFRPRIPIIVMTPNKKTYHQMALIWGTRAVLERVDDIKTNLNFLGCYAIQHKLLEYGDFVVVTLGTPYGISHTTNTVTVESIGAVIAKGAPARTHPDSSLIYAKRRIILDRDVKEEHHYPDEILVMTELKPTYLPLLSQAKGLILQNSREDIRSEKLAREYAEKHAFPCIIRADSACSLLENDDWISICEARGLIFRGDAQKEKEMIERTCIDATSVQIHFNF